METNSILAKKEFVIGVIKHLRPIDVIVIFTSLIAMYLFRIQDGYQLNPIWQLKQSSRRKHVTQVQPLISDLDGNILKELIIASEDKLEVFSYHVDEFDDENNSDETEKADTTSSVLYHLHQKAEISFNEIHGGNEAATKFPVAMNSGCTAILHNNMCLQVLAIVWSDWTVTLLTHQLKVLWNSKPMNIKFQPKLKITEMSVLVTAGNKSAFGEHGLVIVGGVLNPIGHKSSDSVGHDHSHDHSRRSEVNKTAEEISHERAGVEPEKQNSHTFSHDLDPAVAKYVGHFTSYALDGRTGEIRWKHEPGDFEIKQEHNEERQPLHFKLRLKKKALHHGEVYWRKYSQSLLNHLPYSWAHTTDTAISLGEFKRTSRPKRTKEDFAKQLMELAKTGVPLTHEKETRDLNAVVISHSRGIEVLDLDKGRPLCSLPLDAQYSTIGDVNGDQNIDLVKLHVAQENSMSECFLVVSDAFQTSSVLFNSSVCHPSSAVDFFGEVASSADENIKLQSLPPLLTKTVKRSFGILGHVLGHSLSRYHVGMDTIVLASSGKLTAVESSGRFLWQVDTGVTWSENNLQHNFTPSMKAVSLSLEGVQDGVIILGSRELMVISLMDGSILSTHSLPCVPMQPLVLGEMNNDISDEFLVRCSDRYIAFSLERYSRIGLTILVYSGIACLVGFQLFVIKFLEREEFPYDTFEQVMKALRLFPLQGTKL